jgi:pimeloyl-ACP methyl ester carboxylesterase
MHGLGRTPADWDGVRAQLARFGDVIAPCVPSDPKKALEVLDEVISPGSIVIGHSMGGVLAMRLAKTRPRPVSAVILTGCFFPPARNGRTLTAAVTDYAAHRISFLKASRIQRGQPANPGSVRPLASLLRLAVVPQGLDRALAEMSRAVLIVHARDDHHVPVDFAIAACARQPAWSLRILDHGGHHAHFREPGPWAAAATSWLEGASRGPASTSR